MERLTGNRFGIPASPVVVAAFFLLAVFSGVWLSSVGRPLSVPVLTAPKVIALVSTALIAVAIYSLRGSNDGQGLIVDPEN